MQTKVFLIRHGITDWNEQGKLLGRRDRPLSPQGVSQGEQAAAGLHGLSVAEIISSPLQRAVQTAEIIARQHGIDVARDVRLADLDVGRWEGMQLSDIAASEEYRQFIDDPLATRIPDGEILEHARRRAIAAVQQALEDNPVGDALVLVTHASIIRMLLAHYMGAPPGMYHRISVSPGSISLVTFSHHGVPQILATNWRSAITDLVVRPGLA